MSLSVLDNLANLIFISAYWVKDILKLRLLSIVGSLVVIPYYLIRSEPLWTPMFWSCVFIGIHSVRAWGIIRERPPIKFYGDEQLLYENTFRDLSPQQFKRLLSISEWQDLGPDLVLHSTGAPSTSLEAIVRGEVEARKDGRLLGRLHRGELVGLAGLLNSSSEFYDAVVTRPTRVRRWQYQDLQELSSTDESLASTLRKIAGAAIADKLIQLIQANE